MLEILGAILVIILLATILIYVIISGLIEPIIVKAISDYKCKGYYAFKPYTDISNVGACFTEVYSINPDLKSFAIYYDDPKRVSKEKCRYTVGAMIDEDMEEEKRENIFSTFRSHGYKIHKFPDIGQAVYCSFPCVTQMSVNLAIARVYPEMSAYILKRRLDARLFMEHYSDGNIHFIAPLERHDDFMMPGIKELENQTSYTASEELVGPSKSERYLPVPSSDVKKRDDDSASSASSFEEVQREECGTVGDVS